MKKILRFLVLTVAMVVAPIAYAQENSKITNIAFDYLLQNIESIKGFPWSIQSSTCDKMPNGGYAVKLKIHTTVRAKEEAWVNNQVNAYGATFNVGIKRGYKDVQTEHVNDYMVFLDANAKPIQHVFAPFYSEIYFWQGKVWILSKKRMKLDESLKDAVDYIWVRDYNGNELSNMKGFYFFDWANTGKTLYFAGNYYLEKGYCSIVRTVDLETNEIKDKLGEKMDIAYGMEFEENAIKILVLKDQKEKTFFTIPYAAKDRDFQIQQVLKKYDLRKASDQIALGERYLNGNIVSKNEKKAAELFEKAANQDNDIGMIKLAECYMKGIGVTQDHAKAFSLYEKATNLGNTDAMIALSDMYAKGDGVAKDVSKALFWKEKLAFNGNSTAQKYVVANYQSVEYEKYNITADEVLRIARDNQKNYNHDWAEFCYKRAISLGSKDAMFDYGKWLYEGGGIKKDCNKAIDYLSQLGEENNIEAQKLLIHIYKDNRGVIPDSGKEMYWLTKAAENGDGNSLLLLGKAYETGYVVKKKVKTAIEYYEKAAQIGNKEAITKVCIAFGYGKGIKKDLEKAILYFKMLDRVSAAELALNIFNGNGIKENKKLGLVFCYIAGNKGNNECIKTYNLNHRAYKVNL